MKLGILLKKVCIYQEYIYVSSVIFILFSTMFGFLKGISERNC